MRLLLVLNEFDLKNIDPHVNIFECLNITAEMSFKSSIRGGFRGRGVGVYTPLKTVNCPFYLVKFYHNTALGKMKCPLSAFHFN
jgi:hypothetical protein